MRIVHAWPYLSLNCVHGHTILGQPLPSCTHLAVFSQLVVYKFYVGRVVKGKAIGFLCTKSNSYKISVHPPSAECQPNLCTSNTVVDLFSGRMKGRFVQRTPELVQPMSSCTQFHCTSHTRVRVHDHYTSSTLIGGKLGASPSSLHTMREGPMEYVCECKMDVKSTWIPT